MRKLLLMLVTLLYLVPLLFLLWGSLRSDESGRLSGENFRDVCQRIDFGHLLLSSALITGVTVAVGLWVNASAAYAFARLQWRGREFCWQAVLLLLVVPFEAIAVPLFYQVTMLGWRDTYAVQIFPFVGNAFSIFLLYTFFLELPHELEEAAALDGATPWQTFWLVAVPNSRPAFATVTILTFLQSWGSYLWPLMVTAGERVRPLSLAVATFHSTPPLQWGDIFAFGTMMVVPVMLLFLLLQPWFVASSISSGIQG